MGHPKKNKHTHTNKLSQKKKELQGEETGKTMINIKGPGLLILHNNMQMNQSHK